jgi:PAS domain S-box-containing protein
MRELPKCLEDLTPQLAVRPEAVVITDRAGNVLWINPSFTALTGYEPEEAIGRAPGLRPYGMHTGRSCAHFWRNVLSLDTWSGAVKNRRKDHTEFDTQLTATPVPDETGRTCCLVCAYSTAAAPDTASLAALLEAIAGATVAPAVELK